MFECEVKFGEVKQPPCLSSIEVVRLTEVYQVYVVCEDLDQGRRAQKIVTPSVQCPHDSKQFLIVDVIVVFGRAKCLGKVGTRVLEIHS